MKSKRIMLLIMIVLAVLILACSKATFPDEVPTLPIKKSATPSPEPTVTSTKNPTPTIPVTPTQAATSEPVVYATSEPVLVDGDQGTFSYYSVNTWKDASGDTVVSGLVQNDSTFPVAYLDLIITMTDADGNVTFTQNAYTDLQTIFPGGQSPFTLNTQQDLPAVADIDISADSFFQSDSSAADVVVDNSGFMFGSNAQPILVGEILNPNPFPVHLSDLTVAFTFPSTGFVSGSGSTTVVHYLDPEEKVPFRLNLPPNDFDYTGSSTQVDFFFDARQIPAIPPLDLSVFHGQPNTDQNGGFHLVGQVDNNEDVPVQPSFVAAIFDTNGLVLDVSGFSFLHAIPAGDSLAFDFTDWGPLDRVPPRPGDIGEIRIYPDPMMTRDTEIPPFELEATSIETIASNSGIEVTGSISNDVGVNLADPIVSVTAIDKQTGEVVAANYDWIFGDLPEGGELAFGIGLFLDLSRLSIEDVEIEVRVFANP